jgi:HK97 family phage prohead protease
MKNKLFNLTSTFKSEAAEDGSVMVRGMASTKEFDRAGDSILADAWTKGGLGNFEKNPIILFNHDYNKPIGRATKVTPTADGLHMEAKISKHAECANLIKDGVLGAFSVGFKVKDADYLKETDGLQIKDAELFEVSVVSVPCNQAATFSLAKSFDSDSDYEDFKKTFKSEELSSSKEIDMSDVKNPEIDLEAFAKKVAEETAAKIAMKQAEQKAVEEAQAAKAVEADNAKALEAETIKSSIKSGIETGAEKLAADIQKDFSEQKEMDIKAVHDKYAKELAEKAQELEAMRNSKKSFSDRSGSIEDHGSELLKAKILGAVTGKGWDTDYAKQLQQKTVDFGSLAGGTVGLDVTMTTAFEQEVSAQYKVAQLFREVQVNSGATVMPFAPEPGLASFSAAGISASSNMLTDNSDNNYTVQERILNAKRVIAGTYIGADTDEQVIVSLLPMLTTQLATAHARAIDSAILLGNGSIAGLCGGAGTDGSGSFLAADSTSVADADASASVALTSANVLSVRREMGKYGMDPSQLALILPYDQYYLMMDDAGFADISEVGNDAAAGRGVNPRVTGILGYVYGVPVIASEFLANKVGAAGAETTTAGVIVNTANFVIPRLRGVSIASEFELANQRTAIVASQSLGFEQMAANSAGNATAVRIEYA